MQDEPQKDIVFVGNASSHSENDLEHDEVLVLLDMLLSFDVLSLNLKKWLTGEEL